MPEQDLDVQQIMERIRQSVRGTRADAQITAAQSVVPINGHSAADLRMLDSVARIQDVPLRSHRPLLGWFVVFVTDLLRQLLTPMLERQVTYNLANTRLLTSTSERLAALERSHRQIESLAEQAEALGRHLQNLEARMEILDTTQTEIQGEVELRRKAEDTLSAQIAAMDAEHRQAEARLGDPLASHAHTQRAVEQQVYAVTARASRAERKLRRILHAMGAGPVDDGRSEEAVPSPMVSDRGPDFDYAAFEERFRGSEEWIKESQRKYLPYFEGREQIVDLGCGR